MVDTTTGSKTGDPVMVTGEPSAAQRKPQHSLLSADGTHAITVASAFPSDGTTRVAVVQIA